MQVPPASHQPKIIKCDNCGVENPGSNAVCSNCGSPLPKIAAAPISPIPAAGLNLGKLSIPKKTNWFLIGGILAFLAVCCVVIGALFFLPAKSVEATVVDVHWQTSVPVQEIRAVDYNNESSSPPSDAYNVSCHDESRDVCEQKTIDKGNGYSEVVEECHTETQQYCSYTVDEWTFHSSFYGSTLTTPPAKFIFSVHVLPTAYCWNSEIVLGEYVSWPSGVEKITVRSSDGSPSR